MKLKVSYQEVNIIDFEPTFSTKKIGVRTYSNKNMIELAQANPHFRKLYKELLAKDYMLYFHDQEVSYFSKRTQFDSIFKRKDLHKAGDIYYTLTPPEGNKRNDKAPKRLMVIFSSMSTVENWVSPLVTNRVFFENFPNMSRSLVKNVWVMRIMDFNLSTGSHYVNTVNYPTMEADVQQAISDVSLNQAIAKENIVLYGGSKGGTGALLHGALGDYQAVIVDPIISAEKYNLANDAHYIKDMRVEDMTDSVNGYLATNSGRYKKMIIGSPNVHFNFEKSKGITDPSVEMIVIEDDGVLKHADISKNCIPEQLLLINAFYMNNNRNIEGEQA